MKKYLYMIIFILLTAALFSCSTTSKETSKEVVDIIESFETQDINLDFDDDLLTFTHKGDAYYLLGEKNDYIELIMYYKQKYVCMFMRFDNHDNEELKINALTIEYFDLLDEIYISINANSMEYSYDFEDKTYDVFFEELSKLSLGDIEWILTTLEML
ncbi:hypothetical protein KHQ88_03255 [Mycoplasmatota bacterium]|nr:hypothetical protein KHQ88_03255 [Mycoplasmatota bacterium]